MTAQRWVYRWNEGKLERVGAVSMAYLSVWEYEAGSGQPWPVNEPDADLVVPWRTRRPDLAPPEIWVGETQLEQELVAPFVRAAPRPVPLVRRS